MARAHHAHLLTNRFLPSQWSYTGALVPGRPGLRLCIMIQPAHRKTSTPMIQCVQASMFATVPKRRIQGAMKTQIPNKTLTHQTYVGILDTSAQIATSIMTMPQIQAFHELAGLNHVTEYQGEMKRIAPRIRLTQLAQRVETAGRSAGFSIIGPRGSIIRKLPCNIGMH